MAKQKKQLPTTEYDDEVTFSEMTDEEKALKELHWMHCPKCGNEMQSMLFKGITIDRCPKCFGIYLDHGEMEKILEDEEGTITSVFQMANKI